MSNYLEQVHQAGSARNVLVRAGLAGFLAVALMLFALPMFALGAVAAQEATTPDTPVVAEVSAEGDSLVWTLQIDYEYTDVRVVVSGPGDLSITRDFGDKEAISIQLVDDAGQPLAAGSYQYEMLVTPKVSAAAKAAFEAAVETRDNRVVTVLQEAGELPTGPFAQSGAFAISDGAAIVADAAAPTKSDQDRMPGAPAPLDVVHADDVIVQGSICTGFDCVNNENFGADTLRLKENNLRIHFDDTSSSGSFPSNDWRIVVNDQANGGASYFGVEDSTAGRMPFRVVAGAPSNALYVNSSGRVGIKTANPVLDLHIAQGNTPGVRLEQDGSSGFTAQTWDLAGNEANFFVRDVTNGSKLPFRIQPNAPTSSIVVEGSTGDVGFQAGTNPAASIHVKRTDGTAQVLVEEASGTSATRTLAELKNDGKVFLALNDTRGANPVELGSNGGNLLFRLGGSSRMVQSATDGTMTILGNLILSGGSCTNCRIATQAWSMSQEEMLKKLSSISVVRWDGTAVDPANIENASPANEISVTHLVPDMQSFYDAYGLGLNGEQVAPLDVAAVSLASVQALNEMIQQQQTLLDQQQQLIEAQAAQLAALETRLEQVEAMAHTHTYLPSMTR